VELDTREVEGIAIDMAAAVQAAEDEKGRIDRRWSPEARQEKVAGIDAELMGRLSEMRREGREAVGRLQEALRQETYRAQRARGPQSAEQWAEANARRVFVAEDFSGDVIPESVLSAYDAAEASGDVVGAWLIWRYGRTRLSELATAPGEGVVGGRAARALRLLEERVDAGLAAELEAARARIRQLATQIEKPYGGQEQDRAAVRVAARFGL